MTLQSFFTAAGAGLAALVFAGGALAGGFDREWLAADADLSSYRSVYVAPVEADLDMDIRGRGRFGGDRPVRAADAADKAMDLREEIIAAFDGHEIAAGPGAGVLTIATTITSLKSTRPTMGDYDREPGLSQRSIYAGGASVDITLSENGKVLAELSDAYATSLGDRRPRLGLWDDADRAFAGFARKLAEFVSEN